MFKKINHSPGICALILDYEKERIDRKRTEPVTCSPSIPEDININTNLNIKIIEPGTHKFNNTASMEEKIIRLKRFLLEI